ncbi:carbohydrate ABC transporter permease [Geochorda subterranea]|uniref:Sugar ABC transporter permease n=1 Tax=Geochorda subterranea TaxID=3109564 RepID=A0ABZ1BMB7_9FIRM|nr:sugar ABC transporter permease [Limnochorda sp. LNt]WRP13962.1 sugar ABC transporter permease [Limnochorda sp. LNt]
MSATRQSVQVASGVAGLASRWRYLPDRAELLGWIMLTPALLYVVILVGLPFVLAITLSFSTATAGSLSFSFVGLRNFSAVLHDPTFQRALKNTLLFTGVSQLLVIVLASIQARLLTIPFPGRRIVRFLLLLPWAAPVALSSMAWTWIYDSTFSVINWTLRFFGVLGPGQWLYWLGTPDLAMAAIIIVHVWRMMPFATVVLMAGLSSIPQDVQEAAIIDGASYWRRVLQIELPLLLPVVAVAVLFGVVFTSTDLSVVWLLTRGGPYNSTHVLASLAFQRGILGANLGEGAAIALFLFPVLLLAAVVMLRVARRSEVGA